MPTAKRYLWKTVRLPDKVWEAIMSKGCIATSQNDHEYWRESESTYVRRGWRLGVWRKVKKALLCHSGFHGNRHPSDAQRWGYGCGLALIEVRGQSDRRRRPTYQTHESTKECYTEARIVALWESRYPMEPSCTVLERPPIAGALPADYKAPKPKQRMYLTKIRGTAK